MTSERLQGNAQTRGADPSRPPLFAPPLVSVIITSYNYGRFLRQTVRSAREQTYGSIEVIVVDDRSSDDSPLVLEEIAREWRDVQCVQLATNGGQAKSCIEGLRRSKGAYVIFLDSDDVLMPDCVELHLATHMSLRRAVGFTCSDALQVVDGQLVNARNGSISSAFLQLPPDPLLTSRSAVDRLAAEGLALPFMPGEDLRYIEPRCAEWRWSTTSCMCFRRELLELIMAARDLDQLRVSPDGYLAHIGNMFSGSALIDRALAVYRIHGSNASQARATLDGFANFKIIEGLHDKVLRIFVEDFLGRFETYAGAVDDRQKLVEVCALVGYWCRYLDPNARETWFTQALIAGRAACERIVGADTTEGMIRAADAGTCPSPVSPAASPAELSRSSIHDIAMEVWYERQRWGLPYKLSTWIKRRFQRG